MIPILHCDQVERPCGIIFRSCLQMGCDSDCVTHMQIQFMHEFVPHLHALRLVLSTEVLMCQLRVESSHST